MAEFAIGLAALLAGAAFVLAMVRFVRGPRTVDRVIAFDVMTIVSITGIVLGAIVEERFVYLDVALVYALMSFLGVIVVARYLEGGL
ncbi:MAG: monovalent cation/H+ antiporter complex subunit F [Siculibacillus sp.]|nr:monovalent cation/H+ antiporter complex subunit F [Siculibacillus sp.]